MIALSVWTTACCAVTVYYTIRIGRAVKRSEQARQKVAQDLRDALNVDPGWPFPPGVTTIAEELGVDKVTLKIDPDGGELQIEDVVARSSDPGVDRGGYWGEWRS
jgi:hypothetical protein